MAPFRYSVIAAALAAAALAVVQPAAAITATDVMKKMTEKERFGYVTGLVDMLSYQSVLAGNDGRAKCITDAFYRSQDEAWRKLYAAFDRFPDRAPVAIVVALMKQSCGG